MIDEMLKTILTIPSLNLSPAANKELLWRTNCLGDELTHQTFQQHVDDKKNNGPCCFTRAEAKQIQAFLVYWDNLQNQLRKFIRVIGFAWHEVHHKQATGDDVLPLLMYVLPKDTKTLNELNDAFYIINNINQTYYFGTAFHAAIKYMLKSEHSKHDDSLFEKSRQVVDFIKLPENYLFVRIALRLSDVLLEKFQDKAQPEELVASNLYAAYKELYDVINTGRDPIQKRLKDVIKVCKDSEDLMTDFTKTMIRLPESIQRNLDIPRAYHFSLFGTRSLYHREISLATLFTHLDARFKAIPLALNQ